MSATKKLADLQAIADGTAAEKIAARHAWETGQVGALDETRGIGRYADDRQFKRTDEDPDRERALTVALCRTVLERPELVFRSVRSGTALLRLDDERPARRLAEATRAANEAAANLRWFKEQQSAQLAEERAEAAAEATREALNSGDPDRIREALNLGPAKALTTASFRGDPVHRRHAVS